MRAPFCEACLSDGRHIPAGVVEHMTPHKGDPMLFHDPLNLMSLCKTCHDSKAQRLEKSGKLPPRIGADGWPIEETGRTADWVKAKGR